VPLGRLLVGLVDLMMQVAVARARSRSVESVSSPWDTATVRPNETTRPTQQTSATFTPDSTEALFYTTDLTGAHSGTYGRFRSTSGRHSRPQTTAGYTRTTKEQLRAVSEALGF
jgi:hypothetical protein